MAMDYTALKSELQNDPSTLGYVAMGGNDQARADAINLARAGAPYVVQLPTLTAIEVQTAIDPTEFASLTLTQLSQLTVMLSGGVINAVATNVRTIMSAIFPVAGPTRTALVALVKRQGSRAEVLFGVGTVVSHQDVSRALRAT